MSLQPSRIEALAAEFGIVAQTNEKLLLEPPRPSTADEVTDFAVGRVARAAVPYSSGMRTVCQMMVAPWLSRMLQCPAVRTVLAREQSTLWHD
jgi:hypothetical protein